MSWLDRFSHGADVAKWKLSQQRRLLKIQGQIGDIEKNIIKHKGSLIELVMSMYSHGKLDDQDIVQICEDILKLQEHVRGKEEVAAEIKREKPPE